MRSQRSDLPPAFLRYVALTAAVAASALLVVGLRANWRIDAPPLFWLLASLVVVGELLPIPVPRRHGLAKVTISTAFAFAILLRFGIAQATAVYVASVVIAQTYERVAPVKALFNASQYALALMVAAGVVSLTGHLPLSRLTTGELPAVLAGGAMFFVANHALACTAAAFLSDLPVSRYIRDDLAFQTWTAGCLLAFTPAVLTSAAASTALVPVCFLPMLAIYFGGRQAAINSHRASHDSLTDLPNRAALSERLQKALDVAEHEHGAVAVMLLDVDDFKAINDTLGHEFGDDVLTEIAHRLRGALGEHETLARLGGDEFAVVLPGGLRHAEEAAGRLLAALDRPMEIDSLLLHIMASIGIAVFPQHGRSVRELLRHADVALYCAKDSDAGFCTYAEEHDEYSIDRLALAAQLRRGIERGELVVHYQPKAPLHGGAITAVEALVRWNHPQLGYIGPDGFIPLAEQTGVIKPLTERVLEAALHQCEVWHGEGLTISVSVNVSTRSLLDHDLPQMIRTLLGRFHLPPSTLQLEITESRIVADMRRARTALDEIRAMGVKIAIDDFGTGFSSLSQLQQLPIDEIKIDKSFVTRMEVNRNDAVLVRSIIELARNLGLRVTAEGVESESIRSSLRQLGCDYAQGFHIGRPAPANECRASLGEPRRVALAAV
jgi:diguanylate cyclase (GGDEF)-like protein